MNELVIMEDGVEDGCWMLDTGYWMLDACQLLLNFKIIFAHFVFLPALREIDTRMTRVTLMRRMMMDAGCSILDTGYWMLDAGCWIVSKVLQYNLCALCLLTCFV